MRVTFSVLMNKFIAQGSDASGKLLMLGVLSLICFALDFFGVPFIQAVRLAMDDMVLSVKRVANDVADFPRAFSQYLNLKDKNEKLKLENEKLKAKVAVLSNVEKEVEELKAAANLRYRSSRFECMEKVLGFDNSIYSSYVLVSALHGKTTEGAVVLSSNSLVGLVMSSNGHIAKVLPITSCKIFVPVKNANGEHVILTGTDTDEMVSVAIRSNTTSTLNIGDILYTSGEGGTYEQDIPVATITSIDSTKNEIHAKPLVKLNALSFVWTISPVEWGK